MTDTDTEPEWRTLLTASRTDAEEAAHAAALRKRAGAYLWAGAKVLIEDWNSDDDPEGMGLYHKALDALGTTSKGHASKIKTVALAVRDFSLHPECYGNLNEAYRNARRLALPPGATP